MWPYFEAEIGGLARALKSNCPRLDNSLKLRKAIGQCGRPGLQDQRRFDFVEILVPHSRGLRKARPRCDALWSEFLAAPGADDQIGLARDHLLGRHHTVLSCAPISKIGEDVDAAGELDERETQAMPEISGSSHSSKNTLGRFFRLSARFGLRLDGLQERRRAPGPARSPPPMHRASGSYRGFPRRSVG